LYATVTRVQTCALPIYLFKFAKEAAAQMPPRILLFNKAGPNESMDHVVELAYAHSALADPVFPRLYGQARWFRSLDLAPEVVSFAGEKITFPEYSTK